MAFKFVPIILGLAHISATAPAVTLQDLEVADDTAAIGSYIRAVRAAAHPDFHKSYENEGDGEIGYSRKKEGGGKKGYQYFDTFHKKAGDNYEFEKQDAFGHDDEKNSKATGHHHDSKDDGAYGQDYGLDGDEEQDGAYSHQNERTSYDNGDYYDEEGGSNTHRKPKGKAEKLKSRESANEGHDDKDHEELREAAADGNGGIEAHGHDVADYTLPEKYSYGKGDEYSF